MLIKLEQDIGTTLLYQKPRHLYLYPKPNLLPAAVIFFICFINKLFFP